jgi:hypothetical protein
MVLNASKLQSRTRTALKAIYTLMQTESLSFNEARRIKLLRLEATVTRVKRHSLTVKPYLRPAYAACADLWYAVAQAVRVCTMSEVLAVVNNPTGASNDHQRTTSRSAVQLTH